MDRVFLDYSVRKLRQLTARIRECVAKLNDKEIWVRAGEEQNAVGNLLLHLSGNVRQWIVSGIGGKPDIRVRDREFSTRGDVAAADLVARLEGVVEEAAGVLERIPQERLSERITIQKYDVTVLEAVYHVVEHFSQHTGQIILMTKLLAGGGLDFYRHLRGSEPHQETTP